MLGTDAREQVGGGFRFRAQHQLAVALEHFHFVHVEAVAHRNTHGLHVALMVCMNVSRVFPLRPSISCKGYPLHGCRRSGSGQPALRLIATTLPGATSKLSR